SGTATSSTHSSHGDPTRECYFDDPAKCFSDNSCDYLVSYDLASSTNIEFDQHNSAHTVPAFFHGLLGNSLHNLQHTFHTRYTLRGQTATRDSIVTQFLDCFCCLLCYTGYETVYQNLLNLEEKVRALSAATPDNLPEHVTIDSRSISHTAVINNYQTLSSSTTEAIDDNTHIFDLFLNNPETKKWIVEHLNPTTNHMLELIMPGLINTAIPATVHVQERDSEDDSENLQASHFVSLNFLTGTKVQYHLKKLSTNNIQVLAILVSSSGYTLTLIIDNYDVIANQPPPLYAELPLQLPLQKACHCNGACNCATSRNNDTRPDSEDMLNRELFHAQSNMITEDGMPEEVRQLVLAALLLPKWKNDHEQPNTER
ncbi:hypothetical protein, partial [Endozoicomonas sp. SESOKO4]